MLRLSKMADYGMVILAAMVDEPQRSRSASEIADSIRVPVPTVSKVLKMLGRGGLVASQRGARGGYLLARPAGQITLTEIIHAMDGPIGMTECSVTPGLCSQESSCAVRSNWLRINRAVFGVLSEITLDQLSMPIPQAVDISALTPKRASATKRK
ncbi:MAG: SUF system Fe-S cluster assembly regulator [Paraburkholderia sp.]|nr:MAG: SUF system Fe-S cluster assembly regulator [Paraburkholderia sp.]